MKKFFPILTILIALIIVIISIVFAINTKENQNYKMELADKIFIGNLSLAKTGFAMDYNKMDGDEKINNYIQTASNLGTAMNIIDVTSYNNIKNRNDLFDAIYSLYWCMTRSDSREEILIKKRPLIYKYLSEIILNPEDNKDCQALSKLAGDLYSKHTK